MRSYHYKSCSHVIHFLVSIFIWPWAIVWLACAVHVSRHNAWVSRKRATEAHEETTELLRTIAANGVTKEQLLALQNQGGKQ